MSAFEADGEHLKPINPTAPIKSQTLKACANNDQAGCNWLVEANSSEKFCVACRHNQRVPPSTDENAIGKWRKMELAKRYLFYSLLRWKLPLLVRDDTSKGGLAFDFLSDKVGEDGKTIPVLTGHDNGLITINLAEADDVEREKRRLAMGERYRTLMGHFRHEIGHYFWDVLVRDQDKTDACRAIFGDESIDYGKALQLHYQNGAPSNWRNSFISEYATSHPWEDFAETWAHYLHIVDGLETAHAFSLSIRTHDTNANEIDVTFDPYHLGTLDQLIEAWVPVTVALNSLNRSMGQPDLYPFVLSDPVEEKLRFIHDLIRSQNEASPKN